MTSRYVHVMLREYMVRKKQKILPHKNSGKIQAHQHTSYGGLALVLLMAFFPLLVFSASAKTPYDGPEAGSVGLSGVVPGKPPTKAATIRTPLSGQRFAQSPVTVTGTCPQETLVEIFKNDIFAGSTACSDQGTYTLDVDLLIGENRLIARVYDALNQAGPDSNMVVIQYDALPPQGSALTPLDFGGDQLLLVTDAVFRGSFPGQEMSVPITILGGAPPYALNIQWGDGENDVISRSDGAQFNVPHTYKRPGTYQLSMQATDQAGRAAFITVAAIINGQPDIAVGATEKSSNNKWLLLWPLYTSTAAILISFWLGERRERAVLSRRGLLLEG